MVDPHTVEHEDHRAGALAPGQHRLRVHRARWPTTRPAGSEAFGQKPIGSGPYRLERWDKGQRTVLTAFEGYWGGKKSPARIADPADPRGLDPAGRAAHRRRGRDPGPARSRTSSRSATTRTWPSSRPRASAPSPSRSTRGPTRRSRTSACARPSTWASTARRSSATCSRASARSAPARSGPASTATTPRRPRSCLQPREGQGAPQGSRLRERRRRHLEPVPRLLAEGHRGRRGGGQPAQGRRRPREDQPDRGQPAPGQPEHRQLPDRDDPVVARPTTPTRPSPASAPSPPSSSGTRTRRWTGWSSRAARRSTGRPARRSTRTLFKALVDDPPYIYLHAQDSVWAKRATSPFTVQHVRRERLAVPSLQVAGRAAGGRAESPGSRPAPVLPYLGRRLVQLVPTLFGVTLVVFLLVRVSGDPTQLLLPESGHARGPRALPPAARARPSPRRPVPALPRRPASAATSAGRWSTSGPRWRPCCSACPRRSSWRSPPSSSPCWWAVPVGVLSAIRRGSVHGPRRDARRARRPVDGHLLGRHPADPGLLGPAPAGCRCRAATSWRHLVLPAVTLSLYMMPILTRMTRSSMLEVWRQDFVRTARAKGLRSCTVVVRHSLRAALIPVVTVLGLQIGGALAGAIVTESVFAWPGVGPSCSTPSTSGTTRSCRPPSWWWRRSTC